MAYTLNQLVNDTLDGITIAQRAYVRWTDGWWLYQAPEYLTTVYVARALARGIGSQSSLTLEENIRNAVEEAGGELPRLTRANNGRCDIMLWCPRNAPNTIVECKRHVSQFETIQRDTRRICDFLCCDNTIERGAIAYNTAHDGEDATPRELRQFLSNRLDDIESDTRRYVQRRGAQVQNFSRSPRVYQNWAWAPGILVINRI